jgi:hypothetical protein
VFGQFTRLPRSGENGFFEPRDKLALNLLTGLDPVVSSEGAPNPAL